MSVGMKVLKEFTIPFVGLKEGEHNFEFEIDNTFFQNFEFEEFNEANVKASLKLLKKSTLLELYFNADGLVNINCDLTISTINSLINDATL